MSQENVELVERAWVAFQAEDVRALGEMSDENLEFVSVLSAVDTAIYRGPKSWASYFDRMHETWEEWLIEDFRVFDGGAGRIAAVFRLVGKGRSSGARLERPAGIAYRIRNGKLWRIRSYVDPDEALEA